MANTSIGSGSAAYWFQFFLDAGIPPADAGNYAVTFTENRINQDMIADLTKEYLHEMGVKVLGDMIAILKHAKTVHAQAARDKVLKVSGIAPMSASVTSGSPVLPSQPSRLSAATTTAVGKVSANVLPSRLGPSVSDQSLNSGVGKGKPAVTVARASLESSSIAPKSKAPAISLPESTKKAVVTKPAGGILKPKTGVVVKKRIAVSRESSSSASSSFSEDDEVVEQTKQPVSLKQPVSSKQPIPSKQPIMSKQQKKVSIFDRLGQDRKEEKSSPTIKETPPSSKNKTVLNQVSSAAVSSVFKRLGGKSPLKRPLEESVDDSEEDSSCEETKIVPTKRMKTIEDRLGPQKPSGPVSAGIFSSNSNKVVSQPVMLRLGKKIGSPLETTHRVEKPKIIQRITAPSPVSSRPSQSAISRISQPAISRTTQSAVSNKMAPPKKLTGIGKSLTEQITTQPKQSSLTRIIGSGLTKTVFRDSMAEQKKIQTVRKLAPTSSTMSPASNTRGDNKRSGVFSRLGVKQI